MSVTELFDKAAAGKHLDRITIRRPDDFHVHLRDGAMLKAVLPFTAAQFARGVIMPNLVPPVTRVADAKAYRERILAALPAASDFTPLTTCYLTDTTDPAEVNWYLRRNTGCTKTNGTNWAFSSSAKPGIIYLYKNSPADKPAQPTNPTQHILRTRVGWRFLKITLT